MMAEKKVAENMWDRRWEAVQQVLENYSGWLGGQDVSQKETLMQLLKALIGHVDQRWGEFSNGKFEPVNPENGLNYPLDYVYRLILEQACTDFEIIQRIVGQRLSTYDEMRKTLKEADRLAEVALQLAKDATKFTLNHKETTVVTYFGKSHDIRVIPYDSVALIGIPYSCVSNAVDYLAIPHEVGHYVFWHSKMNGDELLFEHIPQVLKDNWCVHWAEEIFADVYGGLVAGPAIAQDFLDLQLACSEEQFLIDDDEHPVPAVRPYIYTQVLKACGEADTLPKNVWDGVLCKKGVTHFLSKDGKLRSIEDLYAPSNASVQGKSLSGAVAKLLSSCFGDVGKLGLEQKYWREPDLYGRFEYYLKKRRDEAAQPLADDSKAVSFSPSKKTPFKVWSKRLRGWLTRWPHDPISPM